ncbi:MAG TPA: translocation/assembly module TamB domain-containing protein [Candidatus Baltobacteraceae bacterium]|nr:translocation/assembly module TamB domain-containing protein [Candidatus Baltobacteraceae bacterium]
MRKGIGGALAALLIVLITVAAIYHNGAVRFVLSSIVPLATGYEVQTQDLRLESHHGALVGVHVSRNGQTVLDARRIDVYYDLRDLLPGSKHRFGLRAITVDRPQITIVHNGNGTYNIAIPGAVSGGTRRAGVNNVPLNFTVRVRNASASLIDAYRFYKASSRQRVDDIDIDMSIDSAVKTRYKATGFLEDTAPQRFRIAGTIDYVNGYALHHVQVKAIPIATIGNYFINSSAAHILGGTVRDFDLHAWAYGIGPNSPAAYHLSGSGYLAEGLMNVKSLDSPIAHINGRINVFDSGFTAPRATAMVGHIPIVFSGGIFDFANPQFRLGVDGRGDLRNLGEVAHFASSLPITGGVRIHALVEGNIADPVLMIGYGGKQFNYGQVPIQDPHGVVALYKSQLIVLPFHATYDGMKMHLQGVLALGDKVESTLALHAFGPSSRLPYLGAMVADQPIATEALLHGTDMLFDARGYLVSLTQPQNVNGFYDINRRGVGTFGPISVRTPAGGSLVAGFSLDRPSGNSAFWASVHHLRLREPQPITMPGVSIPELPPIDAHILEANVAGAGSAHNVVIGGRVYMAPATIAGVPFDVIAARFAGPFAASRISSVHADGPWGSFDGNGTFAPNLIVARGGYSGTFAGLRMFLGGFPVTGAISGPMAIAIANGKIFVQAQNAQLRGASMQGIPISSVTGTMAFDNGILRVYSAQAHAAGGTVVAAGSFATQPSSVRTRLTLATTQLDAAQALRGFGVPMQGGTLRAVGAIGPGQNVPSVDAGVVLREGRAAGYGPFGASAEVAIASDTMHLHDTIASLGTTFAHVNGSVGNLAGGVPSYDVAANVPVGRIAPMAQLAGVQSYNTDGSFQGDVQIGGFGKSPTVHGTVAVPVGEINGLGFSNAHAAIGASRTGISIRNGSVEVGSTKAGFSAAVSRSAIAFSMQSRRANLSDFNDYFDTGDTLAGHGRVGLSFEHFNNLTYTGGDVDINGFRYRRFPIGDTIAHWTSLRNVAQGRVNIGGEHGRLRASGTIGFAASAQLAQLVTRSRYDISGTLSDFDLTTWLPALGFSQVPVTGRVDGSAHVRGSFPHLGVTGSASMRDGTVGPLTIERAEIAARTAASDRIDVTRMVVDLPALEATGSGSFGLAASSPVDFQVHAITDDLPRLVASVSKKRLDVRGHIESTLSIGGTFKAPRVMAGVDAKNLDVYGVSIPSFIGQVQLHRKNVVVRNAEMTLPRGDVAIAGSLPLQLQPFAFGPPGAPISMDAIATNVDLSGFASLMGNDTKLGGVLNGHIGISGTAGNPRIFGQLAATGGSYVSALEVAPITNTVAQLTFQGTHATLDRAHAQLGSGTLDASGSLNFGGGLSGGPLGYALTMRTRGAQIAMPQFGSGTFDSTLSLARTPGKLALLKGSAALTNTVISFNSLLALSGGTPGTPSAGPPFNLGFDLGITAGKNVHVRSGGVGLFGLDISGQGTAHLAGTLEKPAMSGQFNSAGGTLTLIDRAFRVEEGRVTFDPANGALPDIYAIATTTVFNPDPNPQRNPTGSTQITARVTGIVPNVNIDLTSSPGGYTKEQLLALLLPLNALAGPIQFTDTGVVLPAGQIAGAPAPGTGALLPNIFVRRENGTVTIGQEAFNILNAQFTNGLLAPLETALGSTLGLSDVNLTVDYGGNVGVTLRRPLASDFYAIYGTTFGVPIRQTYGFAYQPNAFTSAQFTLFFQQGPTPLFLNPGQVISTNSRATAGQAVQGTSGFTFLFQRLF